MSAPIPFPNANGIPILGQPCTVHGWLPTVMLTCNCMPEKTPLLIVGLGAVAQCPACKNAYAISRIEHDGQTGAGAVQISKVILPSEPPATLEPHSNGKES